MRERIWLGDVVRALETARDKDEEAKILALLGFAEAAPPPSAPVPVPDPPRVPEPAEQDGPEADVGPDDAADRSAAPASGEPDEDPVTDLPLLDPLYIEDHSRSPGSPVQPLARPAPEHHDRAEPPLDPLLAPHRTSSILRAALSRRVHEGPVDMTALTDLVARGRPVRRLPRTPVPTLRFGVQVLVDRGRAMQPFRRDQDHLVGRIRSVVGAGLVDVGYFSEVPQRGTGPGARWTRTAYAPPAPGTRVLLLSDLGLGGPPDDHDRATPEDWREFVDLVTRAGCSAVAFVPYPPGRWPSWMTGLLPLFSWDRTTTTALVAAAVP